MHQEMNSEAASSSSPLRVAVPPKRARVEEEIQTNETMQDLDGMKAELERTRKELDEMTKTMLRLTHTESLLIKKLRIARETGVLEAETGKKPKKPDIGRVVESYFNLPNECSSSIILKDSDFILTDRTCARAITADMNFKTALAADFKREYKNIEFLWKQRQGIGGVAALPPAASQKPGKYFCFLMTEATEKQHVDPENVVLSLTRLRDFLVEREVKKLSLPLYDPNRGRLHPQELYALIHLIFSDTNIQVYLHKKYYLSIG